MSRRRKHWGWGYEDQQPSTADLRATAPTVRERLGFGGDEVEEPVPLEAIELPAPRVQPPRSLERICRSDRYQRVAHALGKSYRDVVRGMRGEVVDPPDVVAHPGSEAEVEAILSWCSEEGLAAIPYGGGTSVVGGVEPRGLGDSHSGVVTIDLAGLDRVVEVDSASRAARIQAGTLGPALNEQLGDHDLTLRHFPQSFEYSSLGGWIATRAGGHFATVWTHIDDLVESVRAITPRGDWESFRLPGSGAGPSPDRLLIGSEGILGVITEAWVRVHARPRFKLSAGIGFESFAAGAEAVRELSQSGLNPANCRLLDPAEAEVTGAGPPGRALLVLGFESAHHPVDALMELALEAVRDHGGDPGEVKGTSAGSGRGAGGGSDRAATGREAGSSGNPAGSGRGAGGGSDPAAPGREAEEAAGRDSVGAWRSAFLAAPYLRDTLVACGVLTETFETAITWDRFEDFHASVIEAARGAVAEASGAPAEGEGAPRITCRFTHVYPDGPAPYYSVLAPARRGEEVAQWDEVKAAVSEVLADAGATITHHHAVGRDHRPWYDRQRPEPFANALRAAKRAVDPAATLNPGVLIDP